MRFRKALDRTIRTGVTLLKKRFVATFSNAGIWEDRTQPAIDIEQFKRFGIDQINPGVLIVQHGAEGLLCLHGLLLCAVFQKENAENLRYKGQRIHLILCPKTVDRAVDVYKRQARYVPKRSLSPEESKTLQKLFQNAGKNGPERLE